MKFNRSWIAALSLVAASTFAQAEVVTFEFTGRVNYGLPAAPLGSKVKGSFSYDTATLPFWVYDHMDWKSYIVPKTMTIEVNGHKGTAESFTVDVMNNAASNVEDLYSVWSIQMTWDGTFVPEGMFGFTLGSAPGNTNALPNSELPSKIKVKDFDAFGFQQGQVMMHGYDGGGIVSFVVDKVKVKKAGHKDVDAD